MWSRATLSTILSLWETEAVFTCFSAKISEIILGIPLNINCCLSQGIYAITITTYTRTGEPRRLPQGNSFHRSAPNTSVLNPPLHLQSPFPPVVICMCIPEGPALTREKKKQTQTSFHFSLALQFVFQLLDSSMQNFALIQQKLFAARAWSPCLSLRGRRRGFSCVVLW